MKKSAAALTVAALTSISTAAFAGGGAMHSPDNRFVFSGPASPSKIVPYREHHSPAQTIFSNLATAYPNGLYFSGSGYTIAGSESPIGEIYASAGSFTPASDATASEVDAALQVVSGTSQATVAIYSDSSGAPGTKLWSGKANIQGTFPSCCAVASAKIKGGLKLKGGTQYWVVATGDSKKQAQLYGAWNFATVDQIAQVPVGYNPNNQGWTTYLSNLPPAFAVFSK